MRLEERRVIIVERSIEQNNDKSSTEKRKELGVGYEPQAQAIWQFVCFFYMYLKPLKPTSVSWSELARSLETPTINFTASCREHFTTSYIFCCQSHYSNTPMHRSTLVGHS